MNRLELLEFIKARLDEDEAAARAWLPFGNPTPAERDHIARHDPARVLAEVAAKRELIESIDSLVREHNNTICNDEFAAGRFRGRAQGYADEVLRLLARSVGVPLGDED